MTMRQKVEMALQQNGWKIEDAEKNIEQAQKQIIRNIEAGNAIGNAVFIQQGADTVTKYTNKLVELYETKSMLEAFLASDGE